MNFNPCEGQTPRIITEPFRCLIGLGRYALVFGDIFEHLQVYFLKNKINKQKKERRGREIWIRLSECSRVRVNRASVRVVIGRLPPNSSIAPTCIKLH